MKRIGVVFSEGKPHMPVLLGELRSWVAQMGWQATYTTSRAPDPAVVDGSELVVVLGGDGTFLTAARLATAHGGPSIPLLGVDLGRLGFLSDVAFNDLPAAFERIAANDFRIEDRSMMDMIAYRDEAILGEATALNDAVVSKGAFARLVELATYVDGNYLTTYAADGLVIATPTGSTAYALSAGGPLLTPQLPVFVVAPICPHSLSARPIVISDDCRLRVIIEGPSDHDLVLSPDGQKGISIRMGDHVTFHKSAKTARLLKVSSIDFFARLHGKLNWGSTRRPA